MEGEKDKKTTVINKDVEIVGTVNSAGDIEISGKLSGDLTCAGSAVIGEGCTIKGNISADSVSVSGQVNGNISSKDRIELKATAKITGDIRAKRLRVEDGVTFVGKSEVNPSGAPAGRPQPQPQPEPKGDGSDEKSESDKGKSGVFGKK